MAKLSDEDLHLNLIVNGDEAQKELGALSQNLSNAKAEVKRLNKEQEKLRKQGKENGKTYNNLSGQIEKQIKTIKETDKRIQEHIKTMKLEDLTIKQLQKQYTRLRTLRNNSVPGSKQYQYYEQQLVQVRNRMNELNSSIRNTSASTNRLTKSFGGLKMISATVLFTASIRATRKSVEAFGEYDDKLADVRKTTNMLTEDLHEFDKALQQIETRTSDEDLLDIAWIGGKMGISDPEELRGFVESANQIVVALSKDLGGNAEDAIRSIAKLVDVFGIGEEFGMEKGLLKVGSAINELGMASTANEQYLVDFAYRMAGLAPLAKVPLDQILALGSTLDQLGQTSEVSSTSLNKMFLSLAKEAEVFSKYAGMQVDDFRQLLEDDFMEAFIAVLDGIKDNSDGVNELAKTLNDLGLDGQRVISVVGSLSNNTDILRKEMITSKKAIEEATSVTDEYGIKNENVAAELEKAQKNVSRLWRELGEKLWPTMIEGNKLLTSFLKIISTIITFLYENRKIVAATTASILAFTIAVNRAAIGLAIKTGWIKTSTTAMRIFNAVVKMNPIARLVAILASAATALYIFQDRTDSATRAQDEFNRTAKEVERSMAGQISAIERNRDAAEDLRLEEHKRLAAVKELRDLMPDVLKDYSDEEIMIGKATVAIRAQVKERIKLAQVKAYERKLDEIADKKVQLEDQRDRGQSGATFMERVRSLPSAVKNWTKSYGEIVDDSISDLEKQEELFTKRLLELQAEQVKKIKKEEEEEEDEEENNKVDGDASNDKKSKADAIEREKQYWDDIKETQQEGYNQELYQLDKKFQQTKKILGENHKDLEGIEKTYIDQRAKIIADLGDKAQEEELKAERKRREALTQEWKELYGTAKLEAELYHQERLLEIENSDLAEEEKRQQKEMEIKEHEERLRNIEEERLMTRLVILEARKELGDMEIEEERRITDELLAIRAELIKKDLDAVSKANDEKKKQEEELTRATFELKEEQAKAFEAGFALLGSMVQESAAAANALLVLEKAAAAAAVVINLQKEIAVISATKAAFPPLAAALIAKAKIRAGISLATIAGTTISGISANNKRQERQDNKRISGRASGGFFGVTREQDGRRFNARYRPDQRGYIHDPTVIVGEEGAEWVASAQALANPDVSQIISILDTAQRQGQINTLGMADILRQSGLVGSRTQGRATGGYTSSATQHVQPSNTAAQESQTLNSIEEVLKDLRNEIRKGITAEVALLGRNGLEARQKELQNIRDKAKL